MAATKVIVNRKVYAKTLFPLLLKDVSELTDGQIVQLLTVEEELINMAEAIRGKIFGLKKIQRYRARKKELDELSTAELTERQKEIDQSRTYFFATVDDDDVGDSCFETPSIDSDEHIIYELLKERKMNEWPK